MTLEKTFFPGSRKELLVEALTLLKNTAGETRIKLGLAMPFGDGRLVGMPSWVGESYDHMGKEDTLERSTKFEVELNDMTLFVHTTEETEKPAQTLFNVMLKNFSMSREGQDDDAEELSDVSLHFVAYVPASEVAWSWLYRHYRSSIFVRFETTQAELAEQAAKVDAQMTLSAVGAD